MEDKSAVSQGINESILTYLLPFSRQTVDNSKLKMHKHQHIGNSVLYFVKDLYYWQYTVGGSILKYYHNPKPKNNCFFLNLKDDLTAASDVSLLSCQSLLEVEVLLQGTES
eukprot:10209231-Ditylum_brightwellii.AAC.1